MDNRLLGTDDIPQAMALWKEAFGDSDAFIAWYFENKVKAGSSLGLFEAGALISVLHMIPYTISVQGRHLQTAFIAGAATSKQRQGQGHMRLLLHESLVLLKSRGITMTHLYPFKHEFYEKFGWSAYSYVMRQTVTDAVYRHSSADVVETLDASVFKKLYDRMMRGYDGFVVRDDREWQWRLEELAVDGGLGAVLIADGAARAYMLYYIEDGKAQVIETVYTFEEDIGILLGYILSQGCRSATYTVPSSGPGAEKFGMARIVDAQALLAAMGAEALLDKVEITDGFAAWNNIINGSGESLDIAALAALVHRGMDKNMPEKANRFFTPQRACIFETY